MYFVIFKIFIICVFFFTTSGKLIGFTEMGNFNDEINAFQNQIRSTDPLERTLASHVIVYMAHGICGHLTYPFRYFASHGMTSSQLYPCTMEAIRVLAAINLKVRALVSDGASPNRKFYKLMSKSHRTKNPHNDDQYLYFFSDVPHLLKTTRNCVENSFWNKKVRNLEVYFCDFC